ncbi:hypothetical protein H2198_007571 [Neophaeococcomyces mojaviensis]|uniref:Uncharacterized protein n=2 Tax=Neophaeococcomyces mojaviensis TaxID=3383035 RepID=A0ACC2ZUQ2_9EURO|nr:hypothetical protein H2198_009382 [Knufia sp. JES_112]KAJ9653213.1 hypothetical protein H2198_007571 [Knufia sp. JES_112]
MATTTPHDISILITVPANPDAPTSAKPLVSSERRITPTWTVDQLKSKLEPITGIPASSQKLRTQSIVDGSWIYLIDDTSLVGDRQYGLTKGSEIEVIDTRPPGARANFTDVSSVEKYVMPETQYEKLTDTVLAWKKRQKLGRFDPNAKSLEELIVERREKDMSEIEKKGIKVGQRCRIGGSNERRGAVRHVGEILGLGGDREAGCCWVGVEFDEPVGRNDGSARVEVVGDDGKIKTEVKRVFECREKHGGFVRPEIVEVGEEWGVLDDLVDEDMEEL